MAFKVSCRLESQDTQLARQRDIDSAPTNKGPLITAWGFDLQS